MRTPSRISSILSSELVSTFLRFSRNDAGRITFSLDDLCEIGRSTEFDAVCFWIEFAKLECFTYFRSRSFFLRYIASILATRLRALIPLTIACNFTNPNKLR